MNINDFLTTSDFIGFRDFIPRNRDEYLQYAQIAYNLKLNTSVPTTVHIEPTNICNQQCCMCSYPDMKRDKKNIDDVLAYKAIDECAALGVYAVHFFFFGEPFANKKTQGFMKYAKQKNIPIVSVTTNGALLTDEDLIGLIDAGIDSIHFSFEGISREKYQQIRGKDDFDTVKENIHKLLQYKKQFISSKPWVALTYARTNESNEEIESFIESWKNLVNDIHISPQLDNYGRTAIGREKSKINSGGLLDRNIQNRLPCRQLWMRLCVLSNGELVPCAQNIDGELSLGNLKDMTIAEAWKSQKLRRLRARHIMNTLDEELVCKNCIDWDWSGKVDNRPSLKKD